MIRYRYAALPLVLIAAGCTSLEAVRSISGRLVNASQSWNAVSADIVESCLRHQQYNPVLTDCDTQRLTSEGLVASNGLLTAYFKTLQDGASEQNFTVQPGIDALSASAKSIPGIQADEVQAISGLAGLLLRLATGLAREVALRDLIADGAPPARRIIALLQARVPQALVTSIAAERDRMTFEFASYIQRAGGSLPSVPGSMCAGGPRTSDFSAGNFLLALEYCRRFSDLEVKRQAIVKYGESLNAADRALADLLSNRTRLKASELVASLYAIGRELDERVTAVRKAFG